MDNYYDTAKRMYHSSKILHDNKEYHNACYLGGYVIECYAKIIVGASYNFNYKEIAKEFIHDLKLLNKELKYILSNSQFSDVIVDMKNDFGNVVYGEKRWDPIKRYFQNNDIWESQMSNNYQIEIEIAIKLLTKMKLDGYNLI